MAVSSTCRYVIVYTLAFLLSPFIQTCDAGCYFPIEFQGEFVMQSTVVSGSQVQYSQINISAVAIPIWGQCHRRISHNVVILMDSSGGANCIRCFHLNLRSRNVLQVHTEGLGKCYTTEEAAETACPDLANQSERSTEILLYKTREGGGNITEEYCPINGRFTFTFNVDDNSETKVECPTAESELDNCPSGAELKLKFRRCSFEDFEITFQCLGDWAGPGNQRYLALLEKTEYRREGRRSVLPMREGEGPRYRCALYREDPGTGNIAMAFSSDSTCRSDLHSATKGFETLSLSSVPQANWPQQVTSGNCRYPSWMQGQWQHLTVDNNVLTYQDHSTFKTYSLKCLGPDSGPLAERFLVFGRTQCGEEIYSCIWIKRRGANVLEFQLGLHNSTSSINSSFCYDSNFEMKTWKTQARVERIQESPCPIPGEYTGVIPDANGQCAKLWSDCKAPETMYYTVSDCSLSGRSPEVYEEREYRCLGQWEEDGLVYTYTQRLDISAYECFVGKIINSSRIYIKEAGDHCARGMDPDRPGMALTMRGPCYQGQPSKDVTLRPHPSDPRFTKKPLPEPTKPWKPITGRPQASGADTCTITRATLLSAASVFILTRLFAT